MKLYNIFESDRYGRDPHYIATVAADNDEDAVAYYIRIAGGEYVNRYLHFFAEVINLK